MYLVYIYLVLVGSSQYIPIYMQGTSSTYRYVACAPYRPLEVGIGTYCMYVLSVSPEKLNNRRHMPTYRF